MSSSLIGETPSGESRDLLLPTVFLTGAALILAWLDPVYFHFHAYPLETLGAVALELVFVWFAVLRWSMRLLYVGTGLVFATIAVQAATQPSPLSVPILAIWPLRIVLVLMVLGSWAFLMRPPDWLRRAVAAFLTSSVVAVLFWGGPATGTALFGWNIPLPVVNFSPYWLAVDSHNTIYASDGFAGVVWVFDEGGTPKGTIRPARAPQPPTPGPGILPVGIEEQLIVANVSLLPSPTPITGTGAINLGGGGAFDFCGLAVDRSDHLYIVDTLDPAGYKVLRFDREGNITARWDTPQGYGPTRGCLAIDGEHIYLASRFGKIYVLDYEGNVQREIHVAYQPFGVYPDGKGGLVSLGHNVFNKIDVATGEVLTTTLPLPAQGLQIPYQAMLVTKDGDVLVSDTGNNRVLRIGPGLDAIEGNIGDPGVWPGQFQGLGGLAQDAQGRIYAADWLSRVIQRFTPEGEIDALWWAARSFPENAVPEGEID
jgi:DNA-binding beta-propeller fold protein YncE